VKKVRKERNYLIRQNKVGQKWQNFSKVTKILTLSKKACIFRFLLDKSDKFLSVKVHAIIMIINNIVQQWNNDLKLALEVLVCIHKIQCNYVIYKKPEEIEEPMKRNIKKTYIHWQTRIRKCMLFCYFSLLICYDKSIYAFIFNLQNSIFRNKERKGREIKIPIKVLFKQCFFVE